MRCRQCGSYAINGHLHGREKGIDLDYCDVCYWRFRAEQRQAEIERKDKLIEQMRKALSNADDLIDEYAADYEHRDNVDEIRDEIKAALAAEGGE